VAKRPLKPPLRLLLRLLPKLLLPPCLQLLPLPIRLQHLPQSNTHH